MLEKAQLVVESTNQRIPVMYNPNEVTVSQKVETSGDGSNVQFRQLLQDNLVLDLFFDTYEQNTDVRSLTDQVAALMAPSTGTGPRKEPPVVLFSWNQVWFRGMLTQLRQQFTMFKSNGTPVRARLSVTIKSVYTDQEQLESLGYYNCRQLYTVKPNQPLYVIANETLGDPSLWRLIAETNNIADPLTFPRSNQTGMTLIIPDIHKTGGSN